MDKNCENGCSDNKTCFLLITVVEREILTEKFYTKTDAWLTMRDEMIRACKPTYRESVENALGCLCENEYVDFGDRFAIGELEAYMNDDVARFLYDWRIVEVEV